MGARNAGREEALGNQGMEVLFLSRHILAASNTHRP